MKKFTITLSIILVATALMAKVSVPNSFNYQAVVRDTDGEIIANQNVTFRFSILDAPDSGDPVYVETHSAVTNNFGLVNLIIGTGTVISGGLDPGGWSLSEYFLKVEIDPSGGNSFILHGTSKLQSVPYAFHAQTVAEDMVDDADHNPENELQLLSIRNDTIFLNPDGGHVKLPSSDVGGDNWGTQTVETDATLDGDGTSSAPLKIAQQGATAGQALLWSGSDWLPGSVSGGGTSPWQQIGTSINYMEGNVGIGLVNPSYNLHIVSNQQAILGVGSNEDAGICLSRGLGDKIASLVFMDSGLQKFWSGLLKNDNFRISSNLDQLQGLEVTPYGDINISGDLNLSGNLSSNLNILTGKKIGIGVTDPEYAVEVMGGYESYQKFYHPNSGTGLYDGFLIGIRSSDNCTFAWNWENGPLIFGTSGENRMAINENGYVGIGTTNPQRILHIYSESNPRILVQTTTDQPPELNLQRGTTTHAIYINDNNDLVFYRAGDRVTFTKDGDVGIGTTSPNYTLDVRGTIGNNTTLYHSDRRWKTDVLPIEYGIDDLMKLNCVSYLWNIADYPEMGFDRDIQFGFIAQDFEQVIPELVRTDKEGYKSIDYVKLTPVLVMAIKELKTENSRLKAENRQIIKRLERLENLISGYAEK